MAASVPKTIPPLVLVPFAMLQSHLFWFCSVVWLLYNNFTPRPLLIEPAPSVVSSPRTVTINDTKKQRPRSFSEPPCIERPTNLQRHKRIQFNTSLRSLPETNVESDSGPRRQRLLRVFSTHIHSNTPQNTLSSAVALMRPNTLDERIGKTCPPLWWQKTRMQIDNKKQIPVAQDKKKDCQDIDGAKRESTDSTISLESGATLICPPVRRRTRAATMLRSKFTTKPQPILSYQSADDTHPVEPTPESTKKHRRATILGITRRFSRNTKPLEEAPETVSDRDQIDIVEKTPKRKVFSRMSRWKKSKRSSIEQ
ncbi:hypothetical protein CLU79DRAFT_735257 [Phycomyces nitens]|nr:hypothetical protein CLU79DRAFT_735257 [Phycomyces nitens]